MLRQTTTAIIGILTCLAGTGPILGQPPDETDDSYAEFLSAAERYEMTTGADEALELRKTPIMNWTNPTRNNELGSIFVWEQQGRPMIVGTVFTYVLSSTRAVRIKHAFHSLAQGPLNARLDGDIVWRPERPGVEWKTIEGEPAAGERQRLVQMRGLARGFKVRLTDDKDRTEVLRLLPKPLYRYQAGGSADEAGAIFGFVSATDPEALLLIESHPGQNRLEWRYAFARFHFITLTAERDGMTVWSVEPELDQRRNRLGSTEFQRRVYTTMLAGERPPDAAAPDTE